MKNDEDIEVRLRDAAYNEKIDFGLYLQAANVITQLRNAAKSEAKYFTLEDITSIIEETVRKMHEEID